MFKNLVTACLAMVACGAITLASHSSPVVVDDYGDTYVGSRHLKFHRSSQAGGIDHALSPEAQVDGKPGDTVEFAGGIGAPNKPGGTANIIGGQGGPGNSTGGGAVIRGGPGVGTGANGDVSLGGGSTSNVYLGGGIDPLIFVSVIKSDLVFETSLSRTIKPADAFTGINGQFLTIQSGKGGEAASYIVGGNAGLIRLLSGTGGAGSATARSGNGGGIELYAGHAGANGGAGRGYYGGSVRMDAGESDGINGDIEIGAGYAAEIHIGRSAGKIGLFGVIPAVQPQSTGNTSGHTPGDGATVTVDSTFTGGIGSTAYTLGDTVRALKQMGMLKN